MNSLKLELNRAGVAALLKSRELEQGLQELAGDICGRCGDGYATDTYQAGTRVIASVSTGTVDAIRDNSENQTILRTLGVSGTPARSGNRRRK